MAALAARVTRVVRRGAGAGEASGAGAGAGAGAGEGAGAGAGAVEGEGGGYGTVRRGVTGGATRFGCMSGL